LAQGNDGDAADLIVLVTLSVNFVKLHAHGHGLSGYCRACRRYLGVPMPVLIAARGADSPVDMKRLAFMVAAGGGYSPGS
jgi:hypothetical protein